MSKPKHNVTTDLTPLTIELLTMGALAEDMLSAAIRGLTLQVPETCRAVIQTDAKVDLLERKVESMGVLLLSGRIHKAEDVEAITNIIRVASDLERIADHATDIAKIGLKITTEAIYKPLIDVPRYGTTAYQMIHDSLSAFVNQNETLASQVITMDDIADNYYAIMRNSLIQILLSDTNSVMQATYLLQVAHFLERICDHSTNIAERTQVIATAEKRKQKVS